jgi:hypothetical protein
MLRNGKVVVEVVIVVAEMTTRVANLSDDVQRRPDVPLLMKSASELACEIQMMMTSISSPLKMRLLIPSTRNP